MMWLILFLFLIIIEIITINLVSVWFALGALFSYVAYLIWDNIIIELIVFIVVSVISLFLTKRFVKNKINKEIERTNADRAIGKSGVLDEPITKYNYGKIKIDGKVWTATSDENISKDVEVEVIDIEGVKLVVRKKEDVK